MSPSGHLPELSEHENESEHNAAVQHRQIARSQFISNRPFKPGPGRPSLDEMDDTGRNNLGDESKKRGSSRIWGQPIRGLSSRK